MLKSTQTRLALLLVAAAALGAAYHKSTEDLMVDAAKAWLVSLDVEQAAAATFDFADSKSREQWHFVPGNNFESTYKYPRQGLTYGHMQVAQRHLADTLLSAGLSRAGFIKAKSIMSLEEILRIKEGDTTGRRDPSRYHFSIFGKPSADGRWGWRVEGHHLSLHFTLSSGKLISTTPTFFGANPHKIEIGPRDGFRALPREEDLGFELIGSLNDAQRKEAIVDATAYKDILTHADTRAKLDGQPSGLAASEMTAKQYGTLLELIEEYASNLPAEVAAARIQEAKTTPKGKLLFAWAGATKAGIGDYYRVQAPGFLIEYDNTQNGANHSHTVWRDWDGDFGRDVLAQHHRDYNHGLARAAD